VDAIAWSGLVASWLLLLLVVKFVSIVLRVLKQTRRLAEMSRDSAVRLAENLADEDAFAQLELVAGQLPDAVRGLSRGAPAARPPTSSVSPGIGGRFS
jgi:hypothetical protein